MRSSTSASSGNRTSSRCSSRCRRRTSPARALVTLLSALTAAAPALAVLPERPATSRGDIRFSLDTASFPSSGRETRQEVYLQIPGSELRFERSGTGYHARIEIEIAFRDSAGSAVVERMGATELPVASLGEAIDPAEMHVLQSDFLLAPGRYALDVRVRDLERRARTVPLLVFIRKRASGRASLDLTVPAFPEGGLRVSDLQFSREIEEDPAETPFRKGRYSVVPCADRVFGLLIPELRFYFELSDPAGAGSEGDVVAVEYAVESQGGDRVASRHEELVLHGEGPWPRVSAFDLSEVPAGRYEVRVAATRLSTGDRAAAGGAIDVVWSAFSWNKKLDDLLAELAPIASRDDLARVKRLSSGEREQFLAAFWRNLDPTPRTARNEALEGHYNRIRTADRMFGSTRTRGLLTDRGRIYVKFGPPDEVSTGFATEEFIGGYFWRPKNEFNFNEEGRARGGYNYKDKAYEIWTYDQRGEQIGDRPPVGSNVGLRFVFVDISGYGDYEMVHSSESVEY